MSSSPPGARPGPPPSHRRVADAAGPDECPFCPGHEAETPPEVARTGDGDPDQPGWRIRVVPNLYPIVDTHEVVVLSPDHRRAFADLDDARGGRGAHHAARPGAGPPRRRPRLRRRDPQPPARRGRLDRASRTRRSSRSTQVPAAVAGAVARVPRGGRRTSCAPTPPPGSSPSPTTAWSRSGARPRRRRRTSSASRTSTPVRASTWPTTSRSARCALALRDALVALRDALGDVPYNVVVHTAPRDGGPFHWYVEVMPRVSVVAGFEQATGILVNTVPPERAAVDARRATTLVSVTIHICITIAAPPDVVWRAVERIETHTEWMPDAETHHVPQRATRRASAPSSTASRASARCTPPTTSWSPSGNPARSWGSSTGARSRASASSGCGPLAGGDATDFCWDERLTFPWWLGGAAGEQLGRPVLARIWAGNLRRLKARVEGGPVA